MFIATISIMIIAMMFFISVNTTDNHLLKMFIRQNEIIDRYTESCEKHIGYLEHQNDELLALYKEAFIRYQRITVVEVQENNEPEGFS